MKEGKNAKKIGKYEASENVEYAFIAFTPSSTPNRMCSTC